MWRGSHFCWVSTVPVPSYGTVSHPTPEALFLDVPIHGMSWPTNGSLNDSLDSRLLCRYIYFLLSTSILIQLDMNHWRLDSREGGHGIPWISLKKRASCFSTYKLVGFQHVKLGMIILPLFDRIVPTGTIGGNHRTGTYCIHCTQVDRLVQFLTWI